MIQVAILSGSQWNEVSVRILFFLVSVVREERNLTKSLILPLSMKVRMSRKTQARDQMSPISGPARGRSVRVSGSMVVGPRVGKDWDEGEKGPAEQIVGDDGFPMWREKFRIDLGECGPRSREGEKDVWSFVRLSARPLEEGGVIGLPIVVAQMLLLRVLSLLDEPLVELLLMVDTEIALIFRNLLNAFMLLAGGGDDFSVTGRFDICDSGAA